MFRPQSDLTENTKLKFIYTPYYTTINALTGNFYSGYNGWRLISTSVKHFNSNNIDELYPCYLTFNQAKKLGGHVRKGQKSKVKVCYYKPGTEVTEDECKWYNVFHISQCKLPEKSITEIEDRIEEVVENQIDNIVERWMELDDTLFNRCLVELIKYDMLYELEMDVLRSIPLSLRQEIWPQLW